MYTVNYEITTRGRALRSSQRRELKYYGDHHDGGELREIIAKERAH